MESTNIEFDQSIIVDVNCSRCRHIGGQHSKGTGECMEQVISLDETNSPVDSRCGCDEFVQPVKPTYTVIFPDPTAAHEFIRQFKKTELGYFELRDVGSG